MTRITLCIFESMIYLDKIYAKDFLVYICSVKTVAYDTHNTVPKQLANI